MPKQAGQAVSVVHSSPLATEISCTHAGLAGSAGGEESAYAKPFSAPGADPPVLETSLQK